MGSEMCIRDSSGVNLSGNLELAGLGTFAGGGFAQISSGQRDDIPILDGYIFGSEMGMFASPGSPDPLVTLTNFHEILAGSAVTLTVYAIGDQDDQVAPITVSDGTQTFTSAFTSATNPYVTFNFTASGSGTFQISANNSVNSSNFAAINGFSLTVELANGSKGDVSRDGFVNFMDIAPMIALLTSSGFQVEADCDCNGVVNFFDISPFINILTGG